MEKKLHHYLLLVILIIATSIFISGCASLEADYKKTAVSINYDEFSRKPDSFKSQPITFTGNINNVKENGKDSDLLFALGKTPILVHYKLKDNEERLVADDTVRVWGEFQKVSSQKLIELAPETSIIEVDGKYISRPKWGFLKSAFGYNAWAVDGKVNSFNGKELELSLSGKNVNSDSIDIEGTMTLDQAYFPLKGKINDDGMGEFEFIDKEKGNTGIKGKLKINSKNEIEVETAKITVERRNLFGPQKTTPVTIEAGTYILKNK